MNARIIDQANALCMAARQAKAKSAQAAADATCSCGKPAVFRGLCRGCDEDKFYSRDVAGARYTGD